MHAEPLFANGEDALREAAAASGPDPAALPGIQGLATGKLLLWID